MNVNGSLGERFCVALSRCSPLFPCGERRYVTTAGALSSGFLQEPIGSRLPSAGTASLSCGKGEILSKLEFAGGFFLK